MDVTVADTLHRQLTKEPPSLWHSSFSRVWVRAGWKRGAMARDANAFLGSVRYT